MQAIDMLYQVFTPASLIPRADDARLELVWITRTSQSELLQLFQLGSRTS